MDMKPNRFKLLGSIVSALICLFLAFLTAYTQAPHFVVFLCFVGSWVFVWDIVAILRDRRQ